jgi:hypothetical protein
LSATPPRTIQSAAAQCGPRRRRGHPIEQEPFSELRDDRKLRKKEKKNLLRR